MNSRLLTSTKNTDNIAAIAQNAISFWLSLRDEATGGFRFTSHQPATLMATAYCILGLEFTGGLSQLSDSQKNAVTAFIIKKLLPDGSFCDPLFLPEDILSKEHDLAYFQEETTTMCQQALDALAAPPPPPRDWNSDYRTAQGIVSYLESLAWQNPWLDSNPVMFVLSQLCHDAKRHQQPELLNIVNDALDWLDAHQSSETGLWQGQHEVSLTNAMAATFHFTFYYDYLGRPLKYVERIIDSCLSLQKPDGLFSNSNAIGQTCLDYDALDLLAKASLITDYRTEDILQASKKAYDALLGLCNPDGGFANCKKHLSNPYQGRKARLLRKLGLSRLLPSSHPLPAKGIYSVCWRLLSCNTSESNAFSTWFRLLGLRLAIQKQWLNTESTAAFTFRRLPFLGYHDPLSVQSIQKQNSEMKLKVSI